MRVKQASLWGRMMKSMNYKPGWWAAYFIYCAIPVVIYIWYLVKRAREVSNEPPSAPKTKYNKQSKARNQLIVVVNNCTFINCVFLIIPQALL